MIDGQLVHRDDNHLSTGSAHYLWARIGPHGLRGLAPFENDSSEIALN